MIRLAGGTMELVNAGIAMYSDTYYEGMKYFSLHAIEPFWRICGTESNVSCERQPALAIH
jgi:hypothetical protein